MKHTNFLNIAGSLTVWLTSLVYAVPEPDKDLPKREAKENIKDVEDGKIVGQIHLYGNRYILKENQGKQWFILLENKTLENMLERLGSMDVYDVEGDVYDFQQHRYLFPHKFQKIANSPQETITVGILEDPTYKHIKRVRSHSSSKKEYKGKKGKAKKEIKKNKKANKNGQKKVKKNKGKKGKNKKEIKKNKKANKNQKRSRRNREHDDAKSYSRALGKEDVEE